MRLPGFLLTLLAASHGLALAAAHDAQPPAHCLTKWDAARDCARADAALEGAQAAFSRGDYLTAAGASECVMRGGADPGLHALHIGARARVRLGCHAEAESMLRRALARRPARAEAGRTWLVLAELYERRKLHAQARDHYVRGIQLLDRPGDAGARAEALLNMGDLDTVRGEFEAAFWAYGRARADAPGPELAAQALDHHGYGLRVLGDNMAALRMHEVALRTGASIMDPLARARALARAHNHVGINWHALAQAAMQRGDRDQARLYLERAIAAEEAGTKALGAAGNAPAEIDARRLGYLLRNTSDMYLTLAQLEPAARSEYLRRALEAAHEAYTAAADKSGEVEWKGLALHRKGVALARSGDTTAARSAFDDAIRLWKVSEDTYSLAIAERFVADEVDVPSGELEAARRRYETALAGLEAIDAEDDIAQIHLALGRLEERAGRSDEAKAAYWRAIEVVEGMRSRLVHDEHKLAFLARRMAPYEALISLLMREYRERGRASDAEAAFDVAERAQGRVLLDMVESAGDRLTAGVDASALGEERRLRREVEQAVARLQDARRRPADLATARETLARAKQALRAYRQELAARDPKYAELTGARVLPLAQLRTAAIGPGEVMLRYHVGAQASYLFVVDRRGLREAIDLGVAGDALARQVHALRAPLGRIHSRLDRKALAAELQAFDTGIAQSLYSTLLGPAERHFAGTQALVIVPHGPLFQLPLEILVKQAPTGAAADLLRALPDIRFALQEAPPMMYALSANLLAASRARLVDAPRPGRVLALVNPRTRRPELPHGDYEAKKLSAHAVAVFQKEQATRQRLFEEAPGYDALHVSTHGEFDPVQPLASGFWLASGDHPRGELVRAIDVFTLRLRARIVSIRACEVGRGAVLEGEGLIGMTRAFKFAGAQRVLAGQWMLDDRSSAELTLAFTRALGAADYAAALKKAKLDLRGSSANKGLWAHPYFWAPMVMYI